MAGMKHLYIGGAFNKYRFIAPNLIKLKRDFARFRLTFYDSWKNSAWNGGRINIMYNRRHATPETVRMYNRLGIGVGITFTNPEIRDLWLKDENDLLALLNETDLNSVAVSNDALAQHIRTNYPRVKIFRSITSFPAKFNLDDLKRLEQQYDLICPRYDWVFTPEFYNNISIEKYEILVNDCCKIGCPVYREHYAAVARYNFDNIEPQTLDEYKALFHDHNCWIDTGHNISGGWRHDAQHELECIRIGNRELRARSAIGFKNFKLLGKASMNRDFVRQLDEMRGILDGV